MKQKAPRSMLLKQLIRSTVVALCVGLLAPGDPALLVGVKQPQDSAAQEEAPKIPNDELDSLVAPIALYPDPLLAQVLAASTYPIEIIQLQQWLKQHKDLKDKALADAVAKQDWDPTVQGLAGLPDVVNLLANDIKWTTDLGNAFLTQQSDVMDAVQRMRAKAQGQGNLKSNEQMKVETKVVESKQVIVVSQANPQVVYVPSYNPVVVYGPPVYPYPPIYYPPPPPPGYAAGMAISFGVGVAMGAAWSGGWCCNSSWGGSYNNNITINNNNTFVNNSNRQNINSNQQNIGNTGNRGQNSNWQHNAQHRGGTPYSDRTTAEKYGGTTRGTSQAARQESARQQQARQQGGGANRAGAGGAQAGTRPSQGQLGDGQGGNRAGAGGAAAQTGNRPSQGQLGGGQAGTANRAGAGAAGGGADRIGNHSVPANTGGGGTRGGSGGAFGGASGGGGGAAAASSRGASSTGGGGSRGGGGGGGRR